ncbi:OB-fold domain-containing protein [Bacillus sp. B15-48]|uniref:Zn-ribbon domain-containing OB-fold protein n=1 Tax=Bacillus sp. B15-48 TaxID=1548601 RepID=UPI00193F94E4|nr:OB-fold domain-containing protein [Bacillus sp. B15-48]MBM4764900.1 DNA-binding protein [Bacillus sp. B15-48]
MATLYESRKMAIPEIHPEHKEYWEAAADGKLFIKHCESCGEYHYYPRVLCPYCMSDKTTWKEAKGTGSIYTYSVMRKGVPYAIAFVTLGEGPRMMTNLVNCDLDTLHIDQRVKVVFIQSGDQDNPGPYVPCFTPI